MLVELIAGTVSVHGTMRDELLHREVFHTLTEARVVIGAWIREYNTVRPHGVLGMRTPAAFAAATGA